MDWFQTAGRTLKWRQRLAAHQGKPVIGLVVSSFDKGGLEQVVLNLYRGYRRRGFDAYILVEENILGPMAQQAQPEHVLVFGRSEGEFLQFCAQKGMNVLHYHYNTFMMEQAHTMGFKILYTIHNIYTWKSSEEIVEYAKILQKTDALIAVSSFVKDYFCVRTGLSETAVRVINNGIDLAELDAPAKLPFTRAQMRLSHQDVAFAFVASFHPVKHQIGMLGVMERLVNENPRIKLLLVGNEGDKAYHDLFMERLNESSARGNIILVPYFSHAMMGAFLRTVPDAFLLPTIQEGCSNAALEAAACGLPMVLTGVGNAVELQSQAACIVVPPPYERPAELDAAMIAVLSRRKINSNTDMVCAAMQNVATHLPALKKLAHQAAQYRSQFSDEAMTDAYLAVVEGLF